MKVTLCQNTLFVQYRDVQLRGMQTTLSHGGVRKYRDHPAVSVSDCAYRHLSSCVHIDAHSAALSVFKIENE